MCARYCDRLPGTIFLEIRATRTQRTVTAPQRQSATAENEPRMIVVLPAKVKREEGESTRSQRVNSFVKQ
jgi:hypothetical protein